MTLDNSRPGRSGLRSSRLGSSRLGSSRLRSSRLGRLAALSWPPVLLGALLVVGWQIAARVLANPQILPTPGAVLSAGWGQRAALWQNTVPTLQETAAGFGLSFVSAWVLAAAMDFARVLRRALYPLLVASQTVPIIVIAPLFVVGFGFGPLPKMLLVALLTFFPLAAALAEGFAAADGDAMRLLRSMGASRWQAFAKVRVPGALPFFFTGLRVAITYAVGGAVYAEYAGAYDGLGIYMQQMQNGFRTDLVIAAVLVIMLLSVLLFASTFAVERALTPWRRFDRAQDAPKKVRWGR
jgi:ABC-type nitrate/sulfonate/bicarbonate transport system permease component